MTSLSVAFSDDTSATVFAGINSSIKDQAQGKNEHLRSFKLQYPRREEAQKGNDGQNAAGKVAETQALSKSSLFAPSTERKQETYQRILRLSQQQGSINKSRIGAVATGLASAGEIVIFDASTAKPAVNDIRHRIQLSKGEEAGDIDIIGRNDNEYLVTYCTDYEVFICVVTIDTSITVKSPYLLHAIPHPDVFAPSAKRPTFRALRFLTPRLLLLIRNKPNRSGAEALLLDVPEFSIEGSILLQKTLHKSVKSASCLAKATIPAPTSVQNIQHVVAIAGQDVSLTILTLDHDPKSNKSLYFRTHAFLRNVHPVQMTALTFSTFKPPQDSSKALPQYLKLASTSMGYTIKVHTFPLVLSPAYPKRLPSRYTLQPPNMRSEQAQIGLSVVIAMVMVALGSFFLQAFSEMRGAAPGYLGVKGWLRGSIQDKIVHSHILANPAFTKRMTDSKKIRGEEPNGPESIPGFHEMGEATSLKDVLARRRLINEGVPLFSGIENKAIVVRDGAGALSTEMYHDENLAAEKGRKWEDLDHHEKVAWKTRLVETGAWAAEEGETVLKGGPIS